MGKTPLKLRALTHLHACRKAQNNPSTADIVFTQQSKCPRHACLSVFKPPKRGKWLSLPMMPVGTHERWCCMHKTQSPDNLTLKQTVHLLAPFSFCFISLLRKDTLSQPRHQRSSKIYHCCSTVAQLKIHFTNKKQEQLTPLIYGASSIASISRSSSAILQLCQQLFTMQSV